jgi:bifunctional DNase/RNase
MTVGLREMVVESVRVHMLSSQHVVILREAERERYLPIWIGSWEAQSIAMKLQGVNAERPLTHDLLASLLGELGAGVVRIVVSELADETYRARIVVEQGGSSHEVDARPSDAIALAVRVAAPIFATDEVLDRAGVLPDAEEEEKLDVFREFVNSLEVDLDAGAEGGSGPREDRPEQGGSEGGRSRDDQPADGGAEDRG